MITQTESVPVEEKSPGNKNPLTRQLKELREKVEILESRPAADTEAAGMAINLLNDKIERIANGASVRAIIENDQPQLLVVIPYHAGDAAATRTLLEWISEIQGGGQNGFPVLLVADSAVPPDAMKELHTLAKKTFSTVRTITAQAGKTGWMPNQMFLWAAHYIADNYRLPFLWLEPDCVPLRSGWLEDIAAAYSKSPMRYLGAIVEQAGQPGLPARHLTGCSVYPNNAYDVFKANLNVTNGTMAWDIAGGLAVAEGTQNTHLIQHFWGPDKNNAPVFVAERKEDSPANHVLLDFIKPEAVLFHRTKTAGLIELLRQKRNGRTVETPAATVTLQD